METGDRKPVTEIFDFLFPNFDFRFSIFEFRFSNFEVGNG